MTDRSELLNALYAAFYGDAYTAHVESYHLHNAMETSRYCDYHNRVDTDDYNRNRAYGTGLGRQAAAEARESGRMQREYDNGKPPRHVITRGGKAI